MPMTMKSPDGHQLSLADGSSWVVQPVSQGLSIRWMAGDPVEPQRVNHPLFPFMLINHRTNNSILARPVSLPQRSVPPYQPAFPQ